MLRDRSKSSGRALDQLHQHGAAVLPALLVIFMAGNLAAIGLELDLREALAPLRDRRFIFVVLVWNCQLCPSYAGLLAWAIPMAQPYAIGLELIGLAPAASFLPMAVRKAGGDLAYAAAFLLIGGAGTVLLMPSGTAPDPLEKLGLRHGNGCRRVLGSTHDVTHVLRHGCVGHRMVRLEEYQ
jgi:ACR3 family arsenite efflux pump ArsB